jgi:hypothetical protein
MKQVTDEYLEITIEDAKTKKGTYHAIKKDTLIEILKELLRLRGEMA